MGDAQILIRAVAEYEARALRWLWPGRIPRGKLTVLSGDPSLGKSFVTLDLAARVSAGRGWPDEEEHGVPEGAGRVLLLAAEDDVCDTIRPRLEAAGADLERVHVVEGLRDAEGNRGFVALHRDCDVLADLLREHGEWRLIVIDPISAYLDGVDANNNADVRILLGRLADLAEASDAAVVLVSHHRKGGYGGPAIHRTIGSLAFAAVARSVWNIVRDPTVPDRRLLVPVKMNLGPPPTGLAYRIVESRNSKVEGRKERKAVSGSEKADGALAGTGVVEWEAWPVEVSADDVSVEAFADTDPRDRLQMARQWLREQLIDGPRLSGELKRLARRAEISKEALWEAKKSMNVSAVKQGHPSAWHWVLPEHRLF